MFSRLKAQMLLSFKALRNITYIKTIIVCYGSYVSTGRAEVSPPCFKVKCTVLLFFLSRLSMHFHAGLTLARASLFIVAVESRES